MKCRICPIDALQVSGSVWAVLAACMCNRIKAMANGPFATLANHCATLARSAEHQRRSDNTTSQLHMGHSIVDPVCNVKTNLSKNGPYGVRASESGWAESDIQPGRSVGCAAKRNYAITSAVADTDNDRASCSVAPRGILVGIACADAWLASQPFVPQQRGGGAQSTIYDNACSQTFTAKPRVT